MARTPNPRSIQPGDAVYGADGERVGTVGAATSTYLMVEKGFLFPTNYYFPPSAVASVADGSVHLHMTRDEALQHGASVPPSRPPLPVTSFIPAEMFARDDDGTVAVPVYTEDLVVTTTLHPVGGTRIDQRLTVDVETLGPAETELRVLVVRRALPAASDPTAADLLEEVIVDIPLLADVPLDPNGREIEELAIQREVIHRLERISHPVRRERVVVTDRSTGAAIDAFVSEPDLPSPNAG